MNHPRILGGTRHTKWAAQIAVTGRRILREAVAEIERLNRTGLDADWLIARSRRDRARIVAAALSQRRNHTTPCC